MRISSRPKFFLDPRMGLYHLHCETMQHTSKGFWQLGETLITSSSTTSHILKASKLQANICVNSIYLKYLSYNIFLYNCSAFNITYSSYFSQCGLLCGMGRYAERVSLYSLIWDFVLSQINIWYGPQQHGLMFGSSYLNHLDMSFLIRFLIWTPASKCLHLTTFTQYLCDFIHVLIFVTISKCPKSPKLTNIVMCNLL